VIDRLRVSAKGIVALALAAIAANAAIAAQETTAAAATGKGNVTARLLAPAGEFTVGDPVNVILEVIHPAGAIVDTPDSAAFQNKPASQGKPGVLPDREDEGGPDEASFSVEEIAPAPQTQEDSGNALPTGAARTAWRIVIRPFAPGSISIPAVTVAARLQGSDDVVNATTEAVTIEVKSVLQSPQESPADIKGPWTIPANIMRLLIIGLLVLAAAVIALILFRRWRAKRRPAVAVAAAPAVIEPAWIRAMRELEALLGSRMIEQGQIKEFHVALAEITKRFLGEHHAFDALDRTSEEVLLDLHRRTASGSVIERTDRFLTHCDLVKFAKHAPSRTEIDETVGQARALIETGRPSAQGAAA